VLTITGYDASTQTLTYSYTLANAETHNSGQNELSEDFHVVATDTDGDSDDAWLNVRIEDDAPTARDDSASASDHQLTATGNVLNNDTLGADYQQNPVTAQTVQGTYGSLVLNADGTYTYTVNTDINKLIAVGASATDSFSYTVTDADGDTSTAKLNITVGNENDGVTVLDLGTDGGEQKVYEANLPDGSNPNAAALTQTGSFSVDAKDGLATLAIDGKTVIENGQLVLTTVTGQLGNVLTITGYDASTQTLTYSYTLANAETHNSGQNELSEDFHVVAT
ncbi:Ig-like domain-containing protein, partial [Pseudomonas typographi]